MIQVMQMPCGIRENSLACKMLEVLCRTTLWSMTRLLWKVLMKMKIMNLKTWRRSLQTRFRARTRSDGHGRRDMGHGLGGLAWVRLKDFTIFTVPGGQQGCLDGRRGRWRWRCSESTAEGPGGSWKVLEGPGRFRNSRRIAGCCWIFNSTHCRWFLGCCRWDIFHTPWISGLWAESRTAWLKLRTTMSRTISWNGQTARWVWSFGCCASLCIFPSTTHCWALSCFHSQKDRPNLPEVRPALASMTCWDRKSISTKAMAPKGTEVVHGLLWSFFALDRELCFPSGLVDWDRSPAKLSETEWNCVLNTLFLAEQLQKRHSAMLHCSGSCNYWGFGLRMGLLQPLTSRYVKEVQRLE